MVLTLHFITVVCSNIQRLKLTSCYPRLAKGVMSSSLQASKFQKCCKPGLGNSMGPILRNGHCRLMSPNYYHVTEVRWYHFYRPSFTIIRLCWGSGKCMIYGYTVSQMGHAHNIEVHFYPRRIGGLHGHTKKFTCTHRPSRRRRIKTSIF